MKNSTLFFRTVLIVAVIAGIPHALAIYAGEQSVIITESSASEATNPVSESTDWEYYWQGRFEVSFEGLKEKAVYELKKEEGKIRGYAVTFIDAQGNQYDDKRLIMEELIIDEYEAKTQYQIEYEGQNYTVESKLTMDEEGNLSLSYEYEGFKGKESWKRLQ